MVVFKSGPNSLHLFFQLPTFTGFCLYRKVEPLGKQLRGVGESTDPHEAGIKDATYVLEYELRP